METIPVPEDWVISNETGTRRRLGVVRDSYDEVVIVRWLGPADKIGTPLEETYGLHELIWEENCTWRLKHPRCGCCTGHMREFIDTVSQLDWFANLREFHEKLGITVGKMPGFRDVELRLKLIREEVIEETIPAIERGDMPEAIDGIIDSIYVLIGAAVTFGVDLRPIWNAVHAANLAKAGGPVREDGKRMKPEGWKPPDVEGLLRAQGWKSP